MSSTSNLTSRLFLIALLCLLPNLASAEDPPVATSLVGDWTGSMEVSGTELEVVFHFAEEDGELAATFDVPAQGAMAIPVAEVNFANRHLVAKVTRIAGSFEGDMQDDGNLLGTWSQGGLSLPLELRRLDEPLPAPRRPQHPEPPFSYRQEEVRIKNSVAEVTLAGTLTLPSGKGPFPAVVLITGSGPQDRDETLMGHKPFLVLADFLTRQGIAVLRHDDRGIGQSTGEFATATSRDFASDTAAAVAFLTARDDIGSVGLVGHSEGGLIAPMVAVEDARVKFLVLLAGPGVSGTEILLEQTDLMLEQAGLGAELRSRNRELHQQALMQAKAEDSEGLSATLRQMFALQMPGLAGEALKAQVEAQTQQLTAPWFRFFLSYDPRTALTKVKVPVLALNGEKDLQVPADANLAAIREALAEAGNERLEAHQLTGLNHLFQHAETGALAEYSQIEETFAEEALELISDWILRQTFPADDG